MVVASGKGGAGTTTVAVNLAVAMAAGGLRTVLVDADLQGGDAAVLCGLEQRYCLADVLAGRKTIHEVLQPGPGAVKLVPGGWGLERLARGPAAAGKRLLRALEGLAGHADLLLVDGGKSPNGAIQQLWRAADLMLLLTTPETSSIINTYSLIKMLAEDNPAVPIHLLVNLAPTADVAEDVWPRLAEACRRFLGRQLTWAGHLEVDPHIAGAAAAGEPFVMAAPDCGAAQHLGRLANTLGASRVGPNRAGPPLQAQDIEPRERLRENVTDSGIRETVKFQKNGKNDSTSGRPQPIGTEHCR
jgi:flagellar biosynthesis protein FlhG